MRTNIFDRLSFLSLFLVIILLPIFCLPFSSFPVETSKGLLLVVGLTACIVFWAIARFIDGKIVFPKSRLIGAGFIIVLITFLSALFSVSRESSLFGSMFDVGSFWFIFAGFILLFMSAVVFRTPKHAKTVLLGSILASAFVLLFQGFRLFVLPIFGSTSKFALVLNKIFSLGILADKTGNVLGSWNALGLFAGFAGLMFLLVVEFFPISKVEKILLQIFILLSILLAASVNFSLVWMLLGISSLIIFVYKVSITLHRGEGEDSEKVKKNFPLTSFVVMIIALLFFVSGPFVGSFIPNHLNISNTEVGPSLGATMSITKGVLLKHPIFGIGPNRFGEAWSIYKPAVVNNTQFWDTSFSSGAGLLTTFTATTGLLGILSWIFFFVLFLLMGIKSVFSSIKNETNWEMMAFFVLSLYLFISSFFYFTGAVIFLISFAFTGVFIGLVTSSSNKEMSMSFLNDHRKSFFSILVIILLVVFSVSTAFTYIERFASVSYFNKAINASTEPVAENSIITALSLYSNDLYLRTYSQVQLVKLSTIVNKGSNLSDSDKTNIQTAFTNAVNGAQLAIQYDPQNYLNYQLLGSIYQTAGSLSGKDAYNNAIKYYQTASSLNPLNPGLKLSIAGVSFINGDVTGAQNYANQALSLKPDYVDALVTLSQLAKNQGNNSQALSYAQAALALSPSDSNLMQYVDSLSGSAPSTPTITPSATTSTTAPTTPDKTKK
jgi:Flp pilus assembly protein TadD